jgi:hypothetical protein
VNIELTPKEGYKWPFDIWEPMITVNGNLSSIGLWENTRDVNTDFSAEEIAAASGNTQPHPDPVSPPGSNPVSDDNDPVSDNSTTPGSDNPTTPGTGGATTPGSGEPGSIVPPTVQDNVITIIVPNPSNPENQWVITISAQGVTIANNTQFYLWFIAVTNGRGAADYTGPFVATSTTDASGVTKLNIDADNLLKPDGTKGYLPTGSYKIKYADSQTGTTYVGTTSDAINILIAGDIDNESDENTAGASGGGCNGGMGLMTVLFAGLSLAAMKKANRDSFH